VGEGWRHAEGGATNVCLSEHAREDKKGAEDPRKESETEESAWLGLVVAVIFFLLLCMVASLDTTSSHLSRVRLRWPVLRRPEPPEKEWMPSRALAAR